MEDLPPRPEIFELEWAHFSLCYWMVPLIPGSWKSQVLEEGAGKPCLAGAWGKDPASQRPSQHTALSNKKQNMGTGPTGEKTSHQKSGDSG